MIVHNLLIKLHDKSNENIANVRELLLSMQKKIDLISDLNVAVDICRAESSYDIALIAKFNTLEDFNAYLTYPKHIEIGTQIKAKIAATASVCYEE